MNLERNALVEEPAPDIMIIDENETVTSAGELSDTEMTSPRLDTHSTATPLTMDTASSENECRIESDILPKRYRESAPPHGRDTPENMRGSNGESDIKRNKRSRSDSRTLLANTINKAARQREDYVKSRFE
jgi:hypothetical protein